MTPDEIMTPDDMKVLLERWGAAQWDLSLPRFAALLGLDTSTPHGTCDAEELFQAFSAALRQIHRLGSENLTALANYRREEKQ